MELGGADCGVLNFSKQKRHPEDGVDAIDDLAHPNGHSVFADHDKCAQILSRSATAGVDQLETQRRSTKKLKRPQDGKREAARLKGR